MRILLPALTIALAAPASVWAGGLLPDRINQIIVQGQFDEPKPGFLVVFSSNPIRDGQRLVTSVTAKSLLEFKNSVDYVAIKLYGKTATRPGRFDYFFGTLHDADRPWNNGDDFAWQDWEKCSPDVWDNVCIAALPPLDRANRTPNGVISSVTIRKGRKDPV